MLRPLLSKETNIWVTFYLESGTAFEANFYLNKKFKEQRRSRAKIISPNLVTLNVIEKLYRSAKDWNQKMFASTSSKHRCICLHADDSFYFCLYRDSVYEKALTTFICATLNIPSQTGVEFSRKFLTFPAKTITLPNFLVRKKDTYNT